VAHAPGRHEVRQTDERAFAAAQATNPQSSSTWHLPSIHPEAGLRNIYAAIASAPDTFSMADPELRDQVDTLKRQKAEMKNEIDRLTDRRKLSRIDVTDEMLAAFGQRVRQRLREGEPAFRRAWLHHYVSEVVVERTSIRIRLRKDPITQGTIVGSGPQEPPVPSFARKWRALRESNPSLQRERLPS
jgi:site-specific DNA recombinase